MRQITRQYGRELYCHRNMTNAKVTQEMILPQAIQALGRDERQAVMQWLTQRGPFWEDAREHGPDDYMECDGNLVTDTAVGEAAWCCLHGNNRHLVSLIPSNWEFTPLPVIWRVDDDNEYDIQVTNHWDADELRAALLAAPVPMSSWEQLATISRTRCPHLVFSDDCFEHLRGLPFASGPAQSLLIRLEVLERLRCCYDENGQRTLEGHRLYTSHFTGDKAWFTDSSDTEKNDFRGELTFRHPEEHGETIFCPWHGKVKTPQLRIHFSWPVSADERMYVVYVGPKITKR